MSQVHSEWTWGLENHIFIICVLENLRRTVDSKHWFIITFFKIIDVRMTWKMLNNTPSSSIVQSGAPGEIESVTVKSIFRLKFQNIFGRSYRIFL